jgi:hypothetical protein
LIYIASPYTSDLKGTFGLDLQRTRFEAAAAFSLKMMSEGFNVFSPIVYGHTLAMIGRLPTDAQFWWQYNIDYLRHADGIFVLRLPGWDQSKGMQAELRQAKLMGLARQDYNSEFELVQ